MNLSFTEWTYPSKKEQNQILAMSPCGLLAHAIDNTLTIYTEASSGQYAPAITWVPFEHSITAICWYDASDVPDLTLPILVFGSESKRVCVFDLAARKVIASMQLPNDPASVIKWSPISSSRFFIGTRNGDILCCSMKPDEEGKLVFKIDWMISVNFKVDYLTFEPSFGDTLAICSKSGLFSFIKRVHSTSPVLIPESYTLCNNANDNEIYSCEFIEASANYMLFVTKQGTILFTIAEHETITLFNDVKLRDLFPVISHGRRLIGINDQIVALYELINGKVERLCEIQIMPSITSSHNNYVTAYVYKNDKLVFVSYNWWLTTIKVVHNKLFVVNRVKLFHEKPLDFSPRAGSLLFSTCNGCIMSTKSTPLAQKKPTRSTKSLDMTNSSEKQTYIKLNNQNTKKNQGNIKQQSSSSDEKKPSIPSQSQDTQDEKIPSLSFQPDNSQTEQIPSFSFQPQDTQDEQIPSFSFPPDNSQTEKIPSFSSQPQDSQTEKVPSFSSQPQDSQTEKVPSFTSMQPSNSQSEKLPSFTSAQPNNSQTEKLPSFSSQPQDSQTEKVPRFPSTQPNISQTEKLPSFPSLQNDNPTNRRPNDHNLSVSFVGIPQQQAQPMRFPSMNSRSRRRISMNLKYSNDETQGSIPTNLLTGNKLNEKFEIEVDPNAMQQSIPPPHVDNNDRLIAIQAMQKLKMSQGGSNPQASTPKFDGKSTNNPRLSVPNMKPQKRLSDSTEQRPPQLLTNDMRLNEGKGSQNSLSSIGSSASDASIPREEKKVPPSSIKQSSSAVLSNESQTRGRSRALSTYQRSGAKLAKKERNQSSDDQTQQKPQPNQLMFGNSRQFNFCFKICDIPLLKAEWVGPNRVFTYGSVKRGDRYINKLFVLDMKTRTVFPILEKRLSSLNMPVTDIIVNTIKKVVVVVLNETVVNFISLVSLPPKVISTINFTSSTHLSFSPDGSRAAILSENGIYLTEIIDPKMAHVKFKEVRYIDIKYRVTAFLWKRVNLIIGSEDGRVLFINLENSKISEVLSIKHSIVSIVDYEGSPTQMIVTDSKHNVYITSHRGIEKTIPYPVKCIKQVSQYDFVVRFYGRGRLSTYNANSRTVPIYSPIINKCLVMEPRDEWEALLNDALDDKEMTPTQIAEIFGMPLMRKILTNLEYPDFTREQMTFIRDIILADSDLNDLAIHLCLDLGEIDRARTIAFKTDGKSPTFVLNIFKAILFETNPRDEIVQAAIVHLITEGKSQDAIDMLLIIGRLKDAVEKLMSIDELKEAQCILKMRVDDDKSLESYMWDIAQRFIESGRLGAGIILFALSGGLKKISDIYKDLGEVEQAQFLEKVLM